MVLEAPAAGNWYAVNTKVRQERRAAENLNAWGVESFAPYLIRRRFPQRPEPLFPGYIFARFDVIQLLAKVCFTRGIARVVSFGGVPAPIKNEIIAMIRSRIAADGYARVRGEFRHGDLIRVKSGPMESLMGIYERDVSGHERVKILLNNVSCGARLDISVEDIVRVTPTQESNPNGRSPG